MSTCIPIPPSSTDTAYSIERSASRIPYQACNLAPHLPNYGRATSQQAVVVVVLVVLAGTFVPSTATGGGQNSPNCRHHSISRDIRFFRWDESPAGTKLTTKLRSAVFSIAGKKAFAKAPAQLNAPSDSKKKRRDRLRLAGLGGVGGLAEPPKGGRGTTAAHGPLVLLVPFLTEPCPRTPVS